MSQQIKLRSAQWDVQQKFISKSLALFVIVGLLSEIATSAQGQPLWLIAQEGTGAGEITQSNKSVVPLELGKPVERELAGGQTHSYQIRFSAGQYAHVVVDQRGIDIVVALFGPDGIKLLEVDSPNGAQGPEPVSIVAEASGSYRLEVRSLEKDAAAGRYEVKLEELRVATEADRSRIVAQKLFAEGAELQAQATAESLRKAADKYLKALLHWRASGDHFGEGNTLSNLGRVYDDLFERHKALDYYNQSLPLKRAAGDRGGEAATIHNIGTVYGSLGEKQKALDHFNQALPLWRAVGDHMGEAITLNSIGLLYSDLGEKRRALDYYNKALPIRQAVGDRSGETSTLNNIGVTYNELGDKEKALDHHFRALSICKEIGRRSGEAITLNNIGAVYLTLSEEQKALDYYNQALTVWRSLGSRDGEAYALSNIGRIYDDLFERQKALEYFDKALSLWRAVGDRDGEARTLYRLALIERRRGNLSKARSHIEAVIDRIESIRSSVESQQLRASFFASVAKRYEFYINVLMQMHGQHPSEGFDAVALQASERARARSLLELLAEANANIRQGVDTKLLESERSLQQQLTAREAARIRLLNSKHTVEKAEEAKKEIETLANQLQDVEAQIRTASPRYAALTQPQPITLSEIQQQVLDPETMLLEYSLGDEHSYLWAVSQSDVTSYELPKRAEIESAAHRFYELLTASNQLGRAAEQSRPPPTRSKAKTEGLDDAAFKLSLMLLAPAASQLETKRLIIVSDGALQYIPFAALPAPKASVINSQSSPASQTSDMKKTSDKGQRAKDSYRPMILDHEIISLPSASILAVLRRELAGRTLRYIRRCRLVLAACSYTARLLSTQASALRRNSPPPHCPNNFLSGSCSGGNHRPPVPV